MFGIERSGEAMPDNIFPYRKFKTVWQDYYK
jgi:hypothetical protein